MSALDTNMLRTLGIGIRTNNLESELRFCFDDDVLDIEDDIIFWDTFTCRERKVFDKQALTPKELEDYVRKTTSKIKELELLDIEDDIIFWDTFTCRERKVFDKQALTPKELEDYVRKTTSKIKELELAVKDVNTVMKEV